MYKGQVYLLYITTHYNPPFTLEHIYKDLEKEFNTTRGAIERALRYYCKNKTGYNNVKEMIWNEYRRNVKRNNR